MYIIPSLPVRSVVFLATRSSCYLHATKEPPTHAPKRAPNQVMYSPRPSSCLNHPTLAALSTKAMLFFIPEENEDGGNFAKRNN